MIETRVKTLLFDKMAASQKNSFFVKKFTLQSGLKLRNVILFFRLLSEKRSCENFKSIGLDISKGFPHRL